METLSNNALNWNQINHEKQPLKSRMKLLPNSTSTPSLSLLLPTSILTSFSSLQRCGIEKKKLGVCRTTVELRTCVLYGNINNIHIEDLLNTKGMWCLNWMVSEIWSAQRIKGSLPQNNCNSKQIDDKLIWFHILLT